jgi:hypothetical protein
MRRCLLVDGAASGDVFAICAFVSVSIGSSWTVVGTIGIGLIGIDGGHRVCGYPHASPSGHAGTRCH